MGIGYALASGLVKGFTENIGREMERRQGEKDRIATIQNAIFTAGLGDDFNNKNVDVIQNMVTKAQQRIDEQGGIDIFGTRGDDAFTSEEMMSVMGQLKSTAKDDDEDDFTKSVIEFKDVKYEFPIDIYGDLTVNDAISAAAQLNFAITSNRDKWKKAPTQIHNAFYTRMSALGTIIANDISKTPKDREYPNLDATGFMRIVDTFDQNMALTPTYDKNKYISVFTDALRNAPDKDDEVGDGTPADHVGGGTIIQLDVTPDQAPYAADIAANFGAKIGPDESNKWWYDYTSTIGYDAAKQETLWESTLEFAEKFKITTAAFQNPLAVRNINEDVAKSMVKFLVDETGGSYVDMSYILGSFLRPQKFGTTKAARPLNQKSTVDQDINDTRLFAARLFINASATDKDFDKIVERHDAIEKVLNEETGLRGFQKLVMNEFDAPAVISRYAKAVETGLDIIDFFFGVGGEEGGEVQSFTTTGITTMTAANATTDGFDAETGERVGADGQVYKVVTTEFLGKQQTKIQIARNRALENYDNGKRLFVGEGEDKRELSREEMASAYARFEAMRISLAFQMARAADPSGRLSNQDVLQQLVRLGGDLDRPEDIVDKIQIAIIEFEGQLNRYAALMTYADTRGPVTKNAKLFMQGSKAFDDLAKRAGLGGFRDVEGTGGEDQSTLKFSFNPQAPNIFTMNGVDYMFTRNGQIKNLNEGVIIDPTSPEMKRMLDELFTQEGLPEAYKNAYPEGYQPPQPVGIQT